MTREKILLTISIALVCIVALCLRLWWLDKAPSGALVDEAHFGYLAQSILQTGRDEHGIAFPLLFTGFGDQKLPANVYLFVPFIAILGLSIFSVRLPSVVAGMVVVGCSYLLGKKLTHNPWWGVVAMLIAALSPWSFFLSRFGFESNTALAFFFVGALCFLQVPESIRKIFWLVGGVLAWAVCWYSYIAYRPVTALLLLVMLGGLVLSKVIPKKQAYLSVFVFILAILPLLIGSASRANTARFQQTGIFSDPGYHLIAQEKQNFCVFRAPVQLCRILWTPQSLMVRTVLNRWLMTFSPQYLGFEGEYDSPFLTVQGFGQISIVLYPFFLLGIIALVFYSSSQKIPGVVQTFLVAGLLFSPIPNILVGPPQKVRLSLFFLFVVATVTLGLRFATFLLKKSLEILPFLSTLAVLLVLGAMTLDVSFYFADYFFVHTQQYDYTYQAYSPLLFSYLAREHPQAFVNIKPFFSDPLMMYAFYTHFDPKRYQELAVLGELESTGFQHTVELGLIHAKKADYRYTACEGKKRATEALYISDENIPDLPLIHRIQGSNGVHTYVYVYDVTGLAAADCQL